MAPSSMICFLVVLATSAAWVQAAEPTLDEYKEAKANASQAEEAALAVQKKMAAVDKVITMMKDLRTKVISDGSTEAQMYNEFACFCKDAQDAKTSAIKKGTSDQEVLTADINSLSATREGLDTKIGELDAKIAKLTKEMEEAKSERAATNAEYTTNEKDTSGAIYALEGAIQSLKASKSPAAGSLVQLQSVAKTVRTAIMMADALGLIQGQDKKVATLFMQSADGEAPEVEMEDYKFHSSDIISTLEKLLKSFKDTKVNLDKDEVASVQTFQMLMQTKTDEMKATEGELGTTKADKDNTVASISQKSEELSVVSSTLIDDQKYLSELYQLCSDKAKTWDQRSKTRTDEIATLTTVIGILEDSVKTNTSAATMRLVQQGRAKVIFGSFASKSVTRSESAMEAIEAATEEEETPDTPPGFLQRHQMRAVRPHLIDGREEVSEMLKKEGAKLKSTLLTALASQIKSSDDPFAKIKVMIQTLIDKLLAEESSEATKKGSCDKNIADSTQKRDYAAEEVMALNGNLAELEASRDTLDEKIATLKTEIKRLKDYADEATAVRKEESETNDATVKEATAGLEAIKMAIDIVDKFYKTVAKEEVAFAQGPADDAPDAGFKNFEAYKGSQAESGGIIGMMDVIRTDFERTITDTQEAEAQAKEEHFVFMTENSKSVKEKEVAEAEQTKINNEVKSNIDDDKGTLEHQMEILKGALAELIQFKEMCIDTGMSYEERVANREDEIADLKKALCILENYAEYGADAEATTC